MLLIIALPTMGSFYHPNHLGSAAWITRADSKPVQYLHYLPYGQLYANQIAMGYDERFKFTGKERDSETGYDYFGARYYWSLLKHWTTVDPLADKYPNISPYAYCNWNPVKYVDPNGREWTDADGNTIQDHSHIKAYIFYNKEDFYSQTMQMYTDLEEQYGKGSVAISNVRTTREFKQDWHNMSSRNIKEVDINHHGNNQTIILDNNPGSPQYITSTGNGLSNKSSSPAFNIGALGNPQGNILGARLNLNTCHSNSKNRLGWISERIFGPTLKGTGQTVMESFGYNFNFNSVRGTSAGVSYNRKTLRPEPQFFFQSWMYYCR